MFVNQYFNNFQKRRFSSCPFETVYRNVHSGLKKKSWQKNEFIRV